ncbi:MAG: hypothetical protein A2289_10330 [Deltaproteobacteria bacterium RIFOXYA12_FULL_58_15]|nr:MAG: hypothetical protein A2289_10330 [Deltaproteobacteria bacterium RIFOXYA12_FULL_58_15]OGR13155.1 MAG: hypothetical protein A2341_08640 [Deltaproteobacteria bacterium RIFOXYB12_FULL_58_9]
MKPVWENRKVVICVGTGGVGKTTAAASLGLAAASQGVRTLVMTIDPARRLANALGITDLGNVEREISAEQLEPFGVNLAAPLWVMMPDVKRTFDQLIERTAPDEESRQRILRNRVYQHFSSALAGSHEYAAVEKLYEVYSAGRYDLIILDTPPSQNAVDFLQAPGRILDFLENETLQWLLKPYVLSGKISLKLLDFGSSMMLRTLGKLAGAETLRELADFVLSLRGTYDGFRQRSHRVRELMRSDEMAFVLVTSTSATQQRAMLQFKRELHAEGLRVNAVVVNRIRRPLPPESECRAFRFKAEQALTPMGEGVLRDVLNALDEEKEIATLDQQSIAELAARLADTRLILLPELPLDVHDLSGLARLYPYFNDNSRLDI